MTIFCPIAPNQQSQFITGLPGSAVAVPDRCRPSVSRCCLPLQLGRKRMRTQWWVEARLQRTDLRRLPRMRRARMSCYKTMKRSKKLIFLVSVKIALPYKSSTVQNFDHSRKTYLRTTLGSDHGLS